MDNDLFDEAKKFARKQVRVARRVLGDDDHRTVLAVNRLAEALFRNGAAPRADLLEAEELITGLIKKTRRIFGPNHHRTTCAVKQLTVVRAKLVRLPP